MYYNKIYFNLNSSMVSLDFKLNVIYRNNNAITLTGINNNFNELTVLHL